MLLSTLAIGLAATKSDLILFGRKASGDAVHVVRLVKVAEIGARIFRVLVLVPQRRRVAELDVGVFPREIDDEGRVVAKRCRQNETRRRRG